MNEPTDLLELERVLPQDLPRRTAVIDGLVRHMQLLRAANETMNLTRNVSPTDAAIKHAQDSLIPWARLQGSTSLLDWGSGPGFPGIPLALTFPETHVLLVESVQKKAEFLRQVVLTLELSNVEVRAERAERVLQSTDVQVVVARAVGSVRELLRLLRPVREHLHRLVLYKGPQADREMMEAQKEAQKLRLRGEITFSYALADGAGERCILEYKRSEAAES